jgi:lysophospholipase L1-like esterase
MRLLKLTLANVAVVALLCVALEGFISSLLFAWDVVTERVTPERHHTRYDPDLGWVAIPNLFIPDMYGPGVFLRTNSHGFRGEREFTEAVPPGKVRMVCSGDSLTLGYGVDDDHSWCKLLESRDQRIESVNMGQSGYGVDQMYLSYKRDGGAVHHHVLLFAPIVDDFRRMQSSRVFGGYGKPLLTVENGSLVIKNVPVPARAYHVPWLTEVAQHLRSLRVTQALERLRGTQVGAGYTASRTEQNERTVEIVAKLLEDLKRVTEERSSQLVLIYLPTLLELSSDDAIFWGDVLERQSRALGIPYIDLVDEFRSLPFEEARTLYLPRDLGHFNNSGNEYVASMIYRGLWSFPEISRILTPGGH